MRGRNAEPSERIPPPARQRGAEQKNFLFLFRRIFWWRAQNQNCKESFSARQAATLRRLAAGWSFLGILAKVSSSGLVKIHDDSHDNQTDLALLLTNVVCWHDAPFRFGTN